jgi:hypothetical protein
VAKAFEPGGIGLVASLLIQVGKMCWLEGLATSTACLLLLYIFGSNDVHSDSHRFIDFPRTLVYSFVLLMALPLSSRAEGEFLWERSLLKV